MTKVHQQGVGGATDTCPHLQEAAAAAIAASGQGTFGGGGSAAGSTAGSPRNELADRCCPDLARLIKGGVYVQGRRPLMQVNGQVNGVAPPTGGTASGRLKAAAAAKAGKDAAAAKRPAAEEASNKKKARQGR